MVPPTSSVRPRVAVPARSCFVIIVGDPATRMQWRQTLHPGERVESTSTHQWEAELVVNHAAESNLLFGLLALQNGLIDQDQLVAAFRAWSRDPGRALVDHLAAAGSLDAEGQAAVAALVALHIKRHAGAAQSLAALPLGRSTRESLAQLGDPQIEATLGHMGSEPGSTQDSDADTDPDRTTSYAVGSATSDGQRFRVLRPLPGAASAPSSWPWTPSSI